jgi:hypothetical protein
MKVTAEGSLVTDRVSAMLVALGPQAFVEHGDREALARIDDAPIT